METFSVATTSRQVLVDVTAQVAAAIASLGLHQGAAVVFVPHTTAGVTINENADPAVCRDVLMALERLVPATLPFTHGEGNSDAHTKASLMGSSVTVPVSDGHLRLGTWQGIYLAEFDGPRRRKIWVQALRAD
ncbi:MAG: secondary thiamine-phosphate synthase enzyme YjbQ [Thermoleophilia bacterium]|jgi:secondary thiamine-phosphate synthase enzyme